ncbi:Uncharacterised protein [uncultured archaeon]|nr:Uncharacterised protein [uncultured archaeon]
MADREPGIVAWLLLRGKFVLKKTVANIAISGQIRFFRSFGLLPERQKACVRLWILNSFTECVSHQGVSAPASRSLRSVFLPESTGNGGKRSAISHVLSGRRGMRMCRWLSLRLILISLKTKAFAPVHSASFCA